MTNDTGRVAFTPSFPVDVLMKSAPAIMQTQLARATFRSEPSSPVARMAFTCAASQQPEKGQATYTTMSTKSDKTTLKNVVKDLQKELAALPKE